MNLSSFNMYDFLMMMVALIICITIHEFAHAYSAYKAGDMTPKKMGRVSLNPIDHLDPMGTIMMVLSSLVGFGIGWGKPVMINPNNFRNPRWDNLRVSLWGPLSNILTALVIGLLLRLMLHSVSPALTPLIVLMLMITQISLALAFFNLIPIHPLDGSHILSALLPTELAQKYDTFMMRHGTMVFLMLIIFGRDLLPNLIGPPRALLFHLFTGI